MARSRRDTGAIDPSPLPHRTAPSHRPRSRPARAVAVLAAAVLVLAACTSDTDPAAVDSEPTPDATGPEPDGTTPDQPDPPAPTDDPDTGSSGDGGGDALAWAPCPDATDERLECATLTVPLDHDRPDGATIELALNRVPAEGERAGAVLVNPGGPGGSGIELVDALGSFVVGMMGLSSFDVVGFDPRGVDESGGLRCLSDAELDELLYPRADDTGPDTAADTVGGELDDERFVEACREAYGDDLQHFSTVATARDMDLVRAALGDETISYIGISYGTYLGAVYATLHPDRVRAMVLDSGFEPTGDTLEQRYLTQLIGFEEAFDAWAAWCDGASGGASGESCAFAPEDTDTGTAWDTLRDRLADAPVPAVDGRAVDAGVLETATIAALYDPITWSRLASALAEIDTGEPTGVLELADLYNGRRLDGTYATIQQSNAVISCASGFGAPPPDDPEALAELIRESAPRWGRAVDADSFNDRCDGLVPPVELPEIGYAGDAPIVVIGGVNDPATPFRWSEELVEVMGPSATLVTWNGEGHGMLFGSNCLMDVATQVIADLSTPAAGTACDPDPDVARPDFWGDIGVPEGVSPEPLGPDALVLLGLPPRLVYAEARTATLSPDDVLAAYADELGAAGFSSFGVEEPTPGLLLETFANDRFDVVGLLVLTDEAYEDDEIAPARRLVDDGETLLALVSFDL